MATRRTSFAAEREDLALLEREARRRGVSLARLLREVVAREASELRAGRGPRIGTINDGSGLAQESVDDEASPATVRRSR